MSNFSNKLNELHNLLLMSQKINNVYNPMEDKLKLEYIPIGEFNVEQLKLNFYANIKYLYYGYCAKTNYQGGTQSDIVDCICDIFEDTYNVNSATIDIDIFLLLKTYVLLLFFTVTAQNEGDIENLLDSNLDLNKKYENNSYFYRGENDYDFSLIPSFYRDKNNFKNDITVVDDKYLKKTYKENGMLAKYKKHYSFYFGYNFLAFMQHTYAYSPFIDFSSSHIIALSFAIKDCKNDCSIYVYNSNNDLSKYRKNDERLIVYSKRRLTMFDLIGEKRVFNCIYKDFEPMVRIHKKRTNDRMKYQKGIFMDFYRGIIINGILLLPVNSESIVKYRIRQFGEGLTKKIIDDKINASYPEYEYNMLMNPYKTFNK